MNKLALAIIGLILTIAVGGVVIWLVSTNNQPVDQTINNDTNTQFQPESTAEESPIGQNTTAPAALKASVEIKSSSFIPVKLTVKKGTTVTWTNKDNLGHNVVSDDIAPDGGPPETADLLGRDDTFSFTFNLVGTFGYHCAPHPFMQGTVEVVE